MRVFKRVLAGWLAVSIAAVVTVFSVKKAVPAFGDEIDDSFSLVVAMGGKEFASSAKHLAEGSALAVMGGIDVDLSAATLGPGAQLNLNAFMGGIQVTLPASWRVEIVSSERMGDVVVDLDEADQDAERPLLLVYAKATMGGISITTAREA